MKTLYLANNGRNVLVDTENKEASNIEARSKYEIDQIYLIDEDCHLVFGSGEDKQERDLKAGQILLLFYTKDDNKIVVIDSEEWKQNILSAIERDRKAQEEWAAKQAQKENVCYDAA